MVLGKNKYRVSVKKGTFFKQNVFKVKSIRVGTLIIENKVNA